MLNQNQYSAILGLVGRNGSLSLAVRSDTNFSTESILGLLEKLLHEEAQVFRASITLIKDNFSELETDNDASLEAVLLQIHALYHNLEINLPTGERFDAVSDFFYGDTAISFHPELRIAIERQLRQRISDFRYYDLKKNPNPELKRLLKGKEEEADSGSKRSRRAGKPVEISESLAGIFTNAELSILPPAIHTLLERNSSQIRLSMLVYPLTLHDLTNFEAEKTSLLLNNVDKYIALKRYLSKEDIIEMKSSFLRILFECSSVFIKLARDLELTIGDMKEFSSRYQLLILESADSFIFVCHSLKVSHSDFLKSGQAVFSVLTSNHLHLQVFLRNHEEVGPAAILTSSPEQIKMMLKTPFGSLLSALESEGLSLSSLMSLQHDVYERIFDPVTQDMLSLFVTLYGVSMRCVLSKPTQWILSFFQVLSRIKILLRNGAIDSDHIHKMGVGLMRFIAFSKLSVIELMSDMIIHRGLSFDDFMRADSQSLDTLFRMPAHTETLRSGSRSQVLCLLLTPRVELLSLVSHDDDDDRHVKEVLPVCMWRDARLSADKRSLMLKHKTEVMKLLHSGKITSDILLGLSYEKLTELFSYPTLFCVQAYIRYEGVSLDLMLELSTPVKRFLVLNYALISVYMQEEYENDYRTFLSLPIHSMNLWLQQPDSNDSRRLMGLEPRSCCVLM